MPSHLRRIFRGPLLLACLVGCLSFTAFTGSASAAADLEAKLIAVPGTYGYGASSSSPVRYELTVTNNGTDASTATPYHFHSELRIANLGGDCTYIERLLLPDYGTCNIGALAPGASQTKHFTAYLNARLATAVADMASWASDVSPLIGFLTLPISNSACLTPENVIICPDPPRRRPTLGESLPPLGG